MNKRGYYDILSKAKDYKKLLEETGTKSDYAYIGSMGYFNGMKETLELTSDKKWSDEDMRKAMGYALGKNMFFDDNRTEEEFFQSLNNKEMEVEVSDIQDDRIKVLRII